MLENLLLDTMFYLGSEKYKNIKEIIVGTEDSKDSSEIKIYYNDKITIKESKESKIMA